MGEVLFYNEGLDLIARSPENYDHFIHNEWLHPIPVRDYLKNITLPPEYSVENNCIIYSSSFVEPFEEWDIYHEKVGILDKHQIKNNDGDIIYEYSLISMKLGEKEAVISFGYIFAVFLMVGIIYLVLMKKRHFAVKK